MRFNIDFAYKIANPIAKIEDQTFNTNLRSIYEVDKEIKAIYICDGDELVGFTTFKRDNRNIEIYNLAVKKNYRRHKLGTKMLSTFTAYNCSLEVRESNEIAHKFYNSLGFKESFKRKNYYDNENAIVFERKKKMTQNAYAKINLILNVKKKLESGMHEIEFLMNSIDVYDVVTVEESDDDQVVVINNEKLSNKNNLAYKALNVLRVAYGFKTNYKITIEKNIPIAAGMAGGSSDAAAVMRIINTLENLGLSNDQLTKYAKYVGSDVAFCIYSKLAIATGTGEKIELVKNTFSQKQLLVVNPGVELATKTVYENHQITNEHGNINKMINDGNDKFEDNLHNDLETTAYKLCSKMEELKHDLQKLTNRKIVVSGSGPTLLVFANDKQEINILYDALKNKYPQIYKATMN